MLNTTEKKTFGRYKEPRVEYPHFIEAQLDSFHLLIENGIKEIFKEFSPIKDYSEKKFDLDFIKIEFSKPKYNEYFAKKNMLTYDAPLRAVVTLKNKTIGGTKEQEIFLTDFPMMTDHGTFIINGVERVIVPQLARSFGVFFSTKELKGKSHFGAKIIPARGAWVEIESEADGAIYVKIDRKRKFPVTSLLRVMGATYDKDMFDLLKHNPHAKEVLEATLEKDTAESVDDAFIEIHRRLRDGDLATAKNAREHIESIFSENRYDLSKVGRRHFNQRFGMSIDNNELERRTISLDDIVRIVSNIITLNNTPGAVADDIDHLGFRRVRYIGELLQQKIRIGMSRMKRNIQDRMSTVEAETTLTIQFINPRPFQAAIKEFFTTTQLSQFMGQQNILSEVEHLRRLSALGPGGLTRERAGFEVRDVHPSHYGRLCPIHTPEGPNIGLILNLATHARINEFGIIETPYSKVKEGKVTSEIVYFNAFEEEKLKIAHAATPYNESTGLIDEKVVEVRVAGEPTLIPRDEIEFMDIATNQAFSIAPSMIPFLEHDDANRALMGSNMQKQATPCILPEAPIIATGIEERLARDSGRLVYATEAGEVTYVDARKIVIKGTKDEMEYPLINYLRTNDFSAFHHKPVVNIGEKVKKGQLLADNSSSDKGQVALGQNIKVAFMSWYGANYEDAIIISERLVKNSRFTSIHVEEFSVSVRDTKLGPEVTTHDIPNVGETKLRNLDEEGIVRIGAEVRPGDILVGKVTPKGETQLTPEERLLRSIFGEKAKDVKDTSLRVEGGKRGRVIGVKVFSRENGDNLDSGIIKKIYVEVAQLRAISVGDKMAGRHGNKGVISRILPEEDMPYGDDGEPVDIILTPLGVPSRMNLGQIYETVLGWAGKRLGVKFFTPIFDGASLDDINEYTDKADIPRYGRTYLYDGGTGMKFHQPATVGRSEERRVGKECRSRWSPYH